MGAQRVHHGLKPGQSVGGHWLSADYIVVPGQTDLRPAMALGRIDGGSGPCWRGPLGKPVRINASVHSQAGKAGPGNLFSPLCGNVGGCHRSDHLFQCGIRGVEGHFALILFTFSESDYPVRRTCFFYYTHGPFYHLLTTGGLK